MDMEGLGDGVCSRVVARLQQIDVMKRISVVVFSLGAAAAAGWGWGVAKAVPGKARRVRVPGSSRSAIIRK